MSVKLLTEHHLKFLSLKGGCAGSSEPILVKMPHCCKSLVKAHIVSMLVSQLSRRFVVIYIDNQCLKYKTLTLKLLPLQSKKDSKDQETIQSSTTPDPEYHMGK